MERFVTSQCWQRLLAFGGGLLLALVQPTTGFWWLLFIAVPLVFIAFRLSRNPGHAAQLGWWSGVGYFGLSLSWIIEPFLVDVERFGWMAPFAMLFMSGGLALFWMAAWWLARKITLRRALWAKALAFSAFWALAEYARGHVLTGFAWGMIGYGWLETPVMQTASLIGSYGLSHLTMLMGAMLGALLLERRAVHMIGVGAMLLLLVLGWFWGAARLSTPVGAGDVKIALVQASISQSEKWDPNQRQANLARHLVLTDKAVGEGVQIIIWPEAAVNYLLYQDEQVRTQISGHLPKGGILITGTQRFEIGNNSRRWFNSLVVFDHEGVLLALYDKHHLVPFGEYLPFQHILEAIGISQLTGIEGGFSSGTGPKTIAVPGIGSVLPLICYEAVFPRNIPTNDRAELLLHVTNDAWFGAQKGPAQHLAQARIRAIEVGLPLLRVANTGISAVIDYRGVLFRQLPVFGQGSIISNIPQERQITVYSAIGDRIMLAIIALSFLAIFFIYKEH